MLMLRRTFRAALKEDELQLAFDELARAMTMVYLMAGKSSLTEQNP